MSGPYHSPAAREVMIKASELEPTTWANIFSEIVMCKDCARMYPAPECRECEKSIKDHMVPSRKIKKTRLTLWWCRSSSAAKLKRLMKRLGVKR